MFMALYNAASSAKQFCVDMRARLCVWVCVHTGTLSINWAGGLRDERLGLLLSQHAPLLSCLAFPGWEPGELSRCTAQVSVTACVNVCAQTLSQNGGWLMYNADVLIMLFENLFLKTSITHTHAHTQCFFPAWHVPVCPLLFPHPFFSKAAEKRRWTKHSRDDRLRGDEEEE